MRLCLDAVLSAEHVVYAFKIICARDNGLSAACWSIILLQVSLLAEFTHLEMISFFVMNVDGLNVRRHKIVGTLFYEPQAFPSSSVAF